MLEGVCREGNSHVWSGIDTVFEIMDLRKDPRVVCGVLTAKLPNRFQFTRSFRITSLMILPEAHFRRI